MITGYPQGWDLTLMQTSYRYPRKDNETGKYDKGSITLVVKDNKTGQKIVQTIDAPKYEFYFAKEDVQIDHNLFFIEKDKVDSHIVPYADLEKEIAKLTDNMEFFYTNIKEGNRYANKMLHTHKRVFFSDMHIEDYYRFKFNQMYQNNITEINKSYLDIEADTINMAGDFPELGECPINAVTLLNEKNKKVYTLLLRNPENPLIEEFENSINNELLTELKDFVIDSVGGWKQATRMGIIDLEFELLFYDDEMQLIQDVFNVINGIQPDFVLAWNMSFDIPYIIERIKILGYNPADIMCHPDFKYKEAKYFIDERVIMEFAERGDFATISSYSVYIDQMIQFASRRKGQSAFNSFKLDVIGATVAKVKKLDYKHITTDIAKLPYLNYKVFTFYNIMDTVVQKCIDSKVNDIEYIFGKAIGNNTRYNKIHRQTVYLANRGYMEFFNDGFIMGNNNNRKNEKPPKFPGAFVADPKLVSDYAKVKINGIPVNLFDNTNDFDYTRLYPSEIQESNMAANTQVGMLTIPEQVHDLENRIKSDQYSRGGNFLEDLASGSYLEFSRRWLKLAGYEELCDEVQNYFTTICNPCRGLKQFTPEGLVIPMDKFIKGQLIKPLVKETGLIKPLYKFAKLNNSVMEDLRNGYK